MIIETNLKKKKRKINNKPNLLKVDKSKLDI